MRYILGHTASPDWTPQVLLRLPLISIDTGHVAHTLPVSGTTAVWERKSEWNGL